MKYKDLEVVNQLMKHGADMTKPRHVRYFLYFTSRDSAATAAAKASQHGFETEVSEPLPQYPDQWPLVCEMYGVVLDLATIREHGDIFDSIAENGGGEYDGWEASV